MPVTIKDIARELGISASTVSRVLNGISTQNKELIRKVKEKAVEMNYQVNTAAVGLRTNKTKLIGIVIPEINDDFFSEILSGVEETTEEQGYNLLICQSHESLEKEIKLIKSLTACNVEGMLISASIEGSKKQELDEAINMSGKKVVFFDRVPKGTDKLSVTIEDEQGTYLVTRHIIDQGSKKPLYIGLSKKLANDKARLSGSKRAAQENGLVLNEFYEGNFDLLPQLIRSQGYDALICYNDHLASMVMNVLKKNDIHIPEDVVISGFDNRPICEIISPTLTSVTHSTKDLGVAASSLLFSLLKEEEEAQSVVLPVQLVVRQSTAQ
ncbi:LacI family DNA-binding transcriptional regulator [Marinoscillum sp. MHG1-6]|uniref:LacI family DNA-binding transcriptional regulator n=1 Tax=Marinoscillum sp. MHG1-6 TaxID=2959627 RepID=UPI0021576996|nr:LacI family DNA-binding transcriptional regulator [Marinoscillum sp. MHG1-6]